LIRAVSGRSVVCITTVRRTALGAAASQVRSGGCGCWA